MDKQKLAVILPLGLTQTIAWASTYYLPAILARPIATELDVPSSYIYAALTGALIIAGLLGPRVGGAIDRVGGRELLCISNVLFALGLLVLGLSHGPLLLVLAWALLGVGMGLGLYEAAFATLTRYYGSQARSAITGITIIAGFASTVGWPLTTIIESHYGWRVACFSWACVHIVLALPLNLWLPRFTKTAHVEAVADDSPVHTKATELRAMVLIGYVFAATGFIGVGLSALLPLLLIELGATPAVALLSATLVGPAQVAARIVEASLLKKLHPVTSTRIATLAHPLGAVLVAFGGPVVAPVFAVLYGAGNGVLTIARGTLPLAVFGPAGYGRRVGLLAMPARITGAAAPLTLGLAIEHFGIHVLWISSAISLSAFVALMLFSTKPVSSQSSA